MARRNTSTARQRRCFGLWNSAWGSICYVNASLSSSSNEWMDACVCIKCTAIMEARTQWHENGANINPYRMYWTFSSVHPKSVQMRWIDINATCGCAIRLTRTPVQIFSQTTEHTQNIKWRLSISPCVDDKKFIIRAVLLSSRRIRRFCTHEYRMPHVSHTLSSRLQIVRDSMLWATGKHRDSKNINPSNPIEV